MSDFVVVNRSDAYEGQAVESLVNGDGSSYVSQTVEVDKERTCTLWVRVFAPTLSADAFYAGVDGNIVRRFPDPAYVGTWSWVEVYSVTLQAGSHTLSYGPGEDQVLIDALCLTDAGLTPDQIDIRLGGEPSEPVDPGGEDPPPIGEVGDLSMVGNENFDPENPTWKDGTPMSSEAEAYHNGLIWYINNTSSHGEHDTYALAAKDDLYYYARPLRSRITAILIAFRVTGDLRLLDWLMELLSRARGELAVGYRGHDTGTVTWPASPYRIWVTKGGGQPASVYGTDLSTMNEVKWHATIAELTWAMYLNRNKTSPNSYDYESEYEYWLDYLTTEFIPKWSGGGTSSWRDKYRGVRRTPTYSNPHGRADAGEWPILFNGGEMHSSVSSTHLAYYIYKLTGNQDALDEFNYYTDAWLNSDSVQIQHGTYGTARLWPHTCPSQGSTANYAQRAVYVGYTVLDHLTMTLEGAHGNVNAELMAQITAALKGYFFVSGTPWDSSSSSTTLTYGDMAGEVARGGMTSNPSGQLSLSHALYYGWFIALPFETVDTKLFDGAEELLTKSWSGGVSTPKEPYIHVGMLLKLAMEEAEVDPGPGDPGPNPEPPPTGTFDLTINTSFSDGNRQLRDGTPFTSTMNDIYDGLLTYWVNGTPQTDHSDGDVEVQNKFNSGNSYQVGRAGFRQLECLMIFFRLTGDVRLLDEATRLGKIAYSNGMRTTWDSGAPILNPSHPEHREPHGERFFPWKHQSGTEYTGNDSHLTDTVRSLRPFAQLGWAQRVNAGASSPKGHNFTSEADKWEDVFLGYERVWSKVNDGAFDSDMKVPQIYKGQPGAQRADLNDWPVNYRTLTHTNHGAGLNSLYMGRLIGKSSVGLDGLLTVMEPWFNDEVLYRSDSTFSGREHAFWGRAYGTMTSNSYYAHPVTYAEYSVLDKLDLFLDGAMDDDVDWGRFWAAIANTYADWVVLGTSSISAYKGDINGKVSRSGQSVSGRSVTLAPSDFGDRTSTQAAHHAGPGLLIPFDSQGKLRDLLVPRWSSVWSNSGTWSQPETLAVPLGVFMDEAGIFD